MAKINLEELARKSMGDSVSNLDTALIAIPADKIQPNEKNFYEKSDLDELAASIELTGLLHPIIVKPEGDDGYTIIDGERRFRAMTDVLGRENIPAIIRRPVNSVIEELMLIEANRQQRKMTAADLSRQAERYTELLSQLKDSGVEIPGRLRTAVAEAMQVSETKLARLHKIRSGLIPSLLEKFDSGDMVESVAYAFAQLEAEEQAMIYGDGTAVPSEYFVRDMADRLRKFSARDCELYGGAKCDHIEARIERCRKVSSWERCEASCCRLCSMRYNCKYACPHIAEEIAAQKAERKAEEKQRKAEEKEAEERRIAKSLESWNNLRRLLGEKGIRKDNPQLLNSLSHYSKLFLDGTQNGKDMEDVISLREAIRLADLLEVELDELANRNTDDINRNKSVIEWHLTELDGVPKIDYGTLIVSDLDGKIRTVADDQIDQTFELMADWCICWAWVEGPEDN